MRKAIDFEEIVKSVRQYIPPQGFDSPFALDSTDVKANPKTLTTLIGGIYKRDYDPKKCAFYMHPTTYRDLIDYDDMVTFQNDYSFQGRPIRTHPTIPEDCILFMAPDAVSLGGKLYHPDMIAYADL
jgi:hypothetical protein